MFLTLTIEWPVAGCNCFVEVIDRWWLCLSFIGYFVSQADKLENELLFILFFGAFFFHWFVCSIDVIYSIFSVSIYRIYN